MNTVDALDEALASFTGLARTREVGDAWEADSMLPGCSVGGLTAHVVQGIGWLATVAAQAPAGDDDLRVVPPGAYCAVVKREPDPPADRNHTLRTFAATRVVELVVHGEDLAVSVGRKGLAPGATALRVAADLLVATAAVRHDPLVVMRTLSRRERAPAGVVPVF